jgi:hypothetical protein
MTRLFKREVELTLARPVAGEFFAEQPNAIIVRDLRVQFSIEKHLKSEPNACTVTISNMAEGTRAEVQRKPLKVTLAAGYDGELERVFTGDLRFAESKKQGVEWETVLQLADGDRAFRHARVNRSFRSGVSGKDVLSDLANSFGLRIPTSAADAKELTKQFTGGMTLSGPTSREMDRLTASTGLTWSIQDGSLQLLRKGQANAGVAIPVSQDAGLIDVPEFGAPKQKGEPPVLSFRMLLYPGMRPGGRILMQSRNVRGDFVVQRLVHTGDTHGGDWTTSVEAIPL